MESLMVFIFSLINKQFKLFIRPYWLLNILVDKLYKFVKTEEN